MPSRLSLSLLAALLYGVAILPVVGEAGVRVLAPAPAPEPTRNAVPRRSNLQLGAGPAWLTVGGESAGAPRGPDWAASAAFEGVLSSSWSWIARGEHARFEHGLPTIVTAAAEVLPSPQFTRRQIDTFESVEVGARLSPPAGPVHPYFEIAGGFGRFERRVEDRSIGAPAGDRNEVSRGLLATYDVAFGAAWQPVGSLLGVFAELRATGDPGSGGSKWLSPRLGLLALQR